MELPTQYALIYITAESRAEALAIGRKLVEERLAACANVHDGMTSVYFWKNRVEQADEAVLLVKTRQSLVPRIVDRVQELHSYDCPCVVALPVVAGSADYLNWISAVTEAAAAPREV